MRFLLKSKKKIRELIINAEIIAYYTGLGFMDIFMRFTEKKEYSNNPYVKQIIVNYRREKPKSEIYKNFFDKVFINILRIAEQRSISISEVFVIFSEVIKKIETAKSKLITSLSEPIIMFLSVALIVYFGVINKIIGEIGKLNMKGLDLSQVFFLSKIYWPIIFAILIILFLVFFIYPRKVPVVKSIYKEIDGYQLLSFIDLCMKLGISVTVFVDTFCKVNKIKLKHDGIYGLLEILKKYLTFEELTTFQMSIETQTYDKVLKGLIEKRDREFEKKMVAIGATLNKIATVLSLIPIIFALMTVFSLVQGAFSLASKGMGG